MSIRNIESFKSVTMAESEDATTQGIGKLLEQIVKIEPHEVRAIICFAMHRSGEGGHASIGGSAADIRSLLNDIIKHCVVALEQADEIEAASNQKRSNERSN